MDNEAQALESLALRAVLEGLPDATVGASRAGTIVFANALAEQQFGYSREELIGRPIEMLWPPRLRDRYRRNVDLYFALEHPLSFTERAHGLRRDGSEFVGEMSWGIVETEDGPLLLAIGRDISERLAVEEQMRHLALHDPLTGLANRTLCLDRIEHALALSQRAGTAAAVLFVDIDNFKRVNDLFGHAAGDALLVALADQISATVRPADTVARLGGDEFVVVCEDVDERTAVALGARVAAAVQEPVVAGGTRHQPSASVGIALGTAATTDADALLGHADAAAYRAKERGPGRVEIFDEELRRRTLERLRTENELEGALERRELELVFQPIVSLVDGSVVAHEALLRWQRLGRRAIDPAEFIPVADESGLIIPIGSWVLEHACHRAAAFLRAQGAPGSWVSVNLSVRQIAEPDLVDTVTASLLASGLAPTSLSLEVTETVLLDVTPAMVSNLARLKELGVRLVLDDFGTGYSSLQHLKDFPIDMIKIDRTFVASLGRGRQDVAIVASVVSMAAALGLDVVAEGVETEEQAVLLREMGCPLAQGFYFGPPR